MTKPWARTELHFGKFTNILGNDRQHKLEKLRYELEKLRYELEKLRYELEKLRYELENILGNSIQPRFSLKGR